MSATPLSASNRKARLNSMITSAGKSSASQRKVEALAQDDMNTMIINVKALRHTVYSVNGDEYTGGWKGFKKHGKGTFKWKHSGQSYEGNWEDNMRNGFGTLVVPKGDGGFRMEYSGEWKRDMKHGSGSNFYSADEYYEGQWKYGKRCGWGAMFYENGSTFEGEWRGDLRNGDGILNLPNGDCYKGSWKDGKKHGPGKYVYKDRGQVYEGVWQDDVPKCGEMKDVDRTAENAPEYAVPELGLKDPDAVLLDSFKPFV